MLYKQHQSKNLYIGENYLFLEFVVKFRKDLVLDNLVYQSLSLHSRCNLDLLNPRPGVLKSTMEKIDNENLQVSIDWLQSHGSFYRQ